MQTITKRSLSGGVFCPKSHKRIPVVAQADKISMETQCKSINCPSLLTWNTLLWGQPPKDKKWRSIVCITVIYKETQRHAGPGWHAIFLLWNSDHLCYKLLHFNTVNYKQIVKYPTTTKSTHKRVNQRSKDVTQVQQQRPESPRVTLTWHKYKVRKLHQRYILIN